MRVVTADGLRLSQSDADRIRWECGTGGSGLTPPDAGESFANARRQVDDFTSIVEAQQVETAAYGADLARGAAEIDQYDSPCRGGEGADHWREMGTRAPQEQLSPRGRNPLALRERPPTAMKRLSRPLTACPTVALSRTVTRRTAARAQPSGDQASPFATRRFKLFNYSHCHSVERIGCCGVGRVRAPISSPHCVAYRRRGLSASCSKASTPRRRRNPRRRPPRCWPRSGSSACHRHPPRPDPSRRLARCVIARDPPLNRRHLLSQGKNSVRNRVVVEPA